MGAPHYLTWTSFVIHYRRDFDANPSTATSRMRFTQALEHIPLSIACERRRRPSIDVDELGLPRGAQDYARPLSPTHPDDREEWYLFVDDESAPPNTTEPYEPGQISKLSCGCLLRQSQWHARPVGDVVEVRCTRHAEAARENRRAYP